MNALRAALAALLPQPDLLPGTRIADAGRVFSVKTQGGDQVAGARLDAPGRPASGGRRCDGLFLLRAAGQDEITPILVELKGTDSRRAITQIVASTGRLCLDSAHATVTGAVPELPGHAGRVLGLVVTRKGLALRQKERKSLREKGIHLKMVSVPKGKPLVKKCRELHRMLHGRGG